MKSQNKPYSAINVFDNLHGIVKRAHVNRVLEKLSESYATLRAMQLSLADSSCGFRGALVMKAYGKFKLFVPEQTQYGEIAEADMDALDEQIKVQHLLLTADN